LHELDAKLSDTELDGIIEEIDEDGSGTVDFDGRLSYIKHILITFLKYLVFGFYRVYVDDDRLKKILQTRCSWKQHPCLL